jgi:hypothetical protein
MTKTVNITEARAHLSELIDDKDDPTWDEYQRTLRRVRKGR